MSFSAADPAISTVHELSAAIQARRLSPVELTECLLERIARLDGKLHSFIALYADDARLAAEAADKAIRAGHSVGPLHGIPIAVKDLVDIAGRVTTGGSKVWQDRVSPVTATLAMKLMAAGMIVIGKTHTVEFAMGGWGTNQHMGTPWNPWDPEIRAAPADRAAAPASPSRRASRRAPSAPTPAARCGCRPRGAASSGSRRRSGGSASTASCRSPRRSTRRGR